MKDEAKDGLHRPRRNRAEGGDKDRSEDRHNDPSPVRSDIAKKTTQVSHYSPFGEWWLVISGK